MRRLTGRTIFVLEHDATDAYGRRAVFEAAGAEVAFAFDAAESRALLDLLDFDAAVLDGIECADICKALGGVPYLFYAKGFAHASAGTPVITKPATATAIVDAVVSLLRRDKP